MSSEPSRAQKPDSYATMWKKVDSLLKQAGLPGSALTEINKIYSLAKKEKNQPQLIKAISYKAAINDENEEDGDILNIKMLEKEIADLPQPGKSILYSITAERYWNYFQNNRWKLYSRTETSDKVSDNITTWGPEDFHKKITAYYDASLSASDLLYKTPVNNFDTILAIGNVRHLRPTLFDLLCFRALKYFESDELTITRPKDRFTLSAPQAFSPAADFVNHEFSSTDSLSNHLKALKLYQRLLKLHLNDKEPDALIDADLNRLGFVNIYSTHPQSDSLYISAVRKIADKYQQLPAAAQAWYLIADDHAQKASLYDPLSDTTHRYEYLKAIKICEEVLKQKDSSEGKTNCMILLQNIKEQSLELTTEKVNLPNQPFRTLVSYKNVGKIYVRIIPVTKEMINHLGNAYEDKYWASLVSLKPIKTYTHNLPATGDYQRHYTEIATDGLPVGEYAFLVSSDQDFNFVTAPAAVHFFHVSAISYIHKDDNYYVLHRETGKPLGNAAVEVYTRVYNYGTQKEELRRLGTYYTNAQGYVKLDRINGKSSQPIQLAIRHEKDFLHLNDTRYSVTRNNGFDSERKEEIKTYLFTDRSIYRPGQTVFLKGLVTGIKGENNIYIKTSRKTTLYLYDANQQIIDSLKVTTNDFGSYSGQFRLPSSVLNGRFTIRDESNSGYLSFSVEEYKRPKFYVEIEKSSDAYKLGDIVSVAGKAVAYAGNNINNANVSYRVVRKPVWNIYRHSYIWPPYNNEVTEITSGTVETDGSGNFKFTFETAQEPSSKNDFTYYTYEISVDVTDLSGETRSSEKNLVIGNRRIYLSMNLPSPLPATDLKEIYLSATNSSGVAQRIPATINFFELQTPQKMLRERMWRQPDQFILDQKTYNNLFPFDVYADEDQMNKWNRVGLSATISDTISSDKPLSLRGKTLKPGWYYVEVISADQDGAEVKTEGYIQLTGTGLFSPFASINVEGKTKAEPGEQINWTIKSNPGDVTAVYELKRQKEQGSPQIISINKTKSFTLNVGENDRGGIDVNVAFIRHNRFYEYTHRIDVPFSNKELDITYTSYRDKTLPGSEEKWSLTIKGSKGEKLLSEVLTGMYDASLDQYIAHQWYKPGLWYGKRSGGWNSYGNFTTVTSLPKYPERNFPVYFRKTYDYLFHNLIYKDYELVFESPVFAQNKLREDGVMALNKLADDASYEVKLMATAADIETKQAGGESELPAPPAPSFRKNFNETAFFFPQLRTDSAGNISFSFTIPEALTTWKWMTLAHTKDLRFGLSTKEIITQKQLMVQPGIPRFLREGDKLNLSVKVANLTDQEMTGKIELQLLDAVTMVPVDGWFQNIFANQYFTAEAEQSAAISFSISVPHQYAKPLVVRVFASSGEYTDGEEHIIPVLSNRIMVTESFPIHLKMNEKKNFKWNNLLQSGNSESLVHHGLTIEFSSNPAWYAIQALPVLAENDDESAIGNFTRYYAHAMSSHILRSNPKIEEIFNRWEIKDTASLISKLEKNPELKNILLNETPWVMEAKSESEQMQRIKTLFDLAKLKESLNNNLIAVKKKQAPSGGFIWFDGGKESRYITQYIVTGVGRMMVLGALDAVQKKQWEPVIKAAVQYLDRQLSDDYRQLVESKADLKSKQISPLQIQMLYMRSFFPDLQLRREDTLANGYFFRQAAQYWVKENKFSQGMIALMLHRKGMSDRAEAIIRSLKETALNSEEMGMYWKENIAGYFWYQAPIETQALLIEAFSEIPSGQNSVNSLKTWLLKHKQTQAWSNTKATADATYALLLRGSDWLSVSPEVMISVGKYNINSDEQSPDVGTGYFKHSIDGEQVNATMGNISVNLMAGKEGRNSEMPAWGAVYWQYFEEMDKIKSAGSPLSIQKKLYVERNTANGPRLDVLNDGSTLRIGDKVVVRIELRVDRDMEFVHMKDLRASSFEPTGTLSGYQWQGGLWYYSSISDASTNFFFEWLKKGSYVFEYKMHVTNSGTFSNGITTIQSLYAPEFSSHSTGIKVTVEEN